MTPSFELLRRLAGTIAGATAVVALVVATPAEAEAAETEIASSLPSELEEVGIEQRIGERLPLDAELVDSDGRTVRLGDYFGDKPVILAPVYYSCPMLCTLVVEGLARSLKALAFAAETDYELVAFSFDPTDTPERARERRAHGLELYGREGADGWNFLTADQETIDRITDAIGFRYEKDEDSGEFFHAATVVLVTPDGVVSRYLYGVEYAPKDLRLGLVEASQENLGSPIDQVLLYCYRYDPVTGKYSLLTMRLVRIGAAATILGLAVMIAVLLRLEKTRPREEPA